MFRIAHEQEASVAELLGISKGSLQWNHGFIRATHEWEIGVFSAFFDLLYSIELGMEEAIRLFGSLPEKFSARSFYEVITSQQHNLFPLKVTFFVWTASLEKILTKGNLRKRWIIIIDFCCMCRRSGEIVDHLFLPYEVARDQWDDIFSRVGLAWRDLYGIPQIAAIWKMVPICLLWCIWRERNDQNFEEKERSVDELRCLFFNTLMSWTLL